MCISGKSRFDQLATASSSAPSLREIFRLSQFKNQSTVTGMIYLFSNLEFIYIHIE